MMLKFLLQSAKEFSLSRVQFSRHTSVSICINRNGKVLERLSEAPLFKKKESEEK